MGRKVASEEFDPIPQDLLAEWKKLIKKGKTLVARRDKSVWQLVLLAGEVQTKYGENRMKRFADEIDIAVRTMYEYRWLNKAGIDAEFIEKWTPDLAYSKIRAVLRHTGRVDSPATNHFLEYALERNITTRALEAYMLDSVAPKEYGKRVGEEMKLALQHKQEAEGFDDYVRSQLEQMVEEDPDLADTIMRYSIIDSEDLENLKVEAGIITDEESTMAEKGKRSAAKIKRYHQHLKETKNQLKEHLAYGHENTDEIRLQLEKLRDIASEILETEQRQIDVPADVVTLEK